MDPLELINTKTRLAYNLVARKYHDLFHDELDKKEYDRALLDSFLGYLPDNALICDAGCGPSGHIGRYIFDRGFEVIGVDISETCVDLARRNNPGMRIERGDIGDMDYDDKSFDGVISYYSIIDTPRQYAGGIFREFHRILKTDGLLLVAVKEGTTEGYLDHLLGIQTEIYLTLFTEDEIAGNLRKAGFRIEFLETRNPYDFEIDNRRIFGIGRKK